MRHWEPGLTTERFSISVKKNVPFSFTKPNLMDTKKFLTGTLVGGIVFFFLGYLIYGMAMADFFTAHTVTTSAMRSMEEIVWWALIVGNLAGGAMLTYIFLKWANVSSFGSGASAAAAIGFFLALNMDMIRFATAGTFDLTGALTNVVLLTVLNAVAGGAIGAVLGMGSKS